MKMNENHTFFNITEELYDELVSQGFAMTKGDFCQECKTHKHLCGHEEAILIHVGECQS